MEDDKLGNSNYNGIYKSIDKILSNKCGAARTKDFKKMQSSIFKEIMPQFHETIVLLDLEGVRRHEMFKQINQTLVERISSLIESNATRLDEKKQQRLWQRLMKNGHKYIDHEAMQPLVMQVMGKMSSVRDRYLNRILLEPRLYQSASIEVLRHVWSGASGGGNAISFTNTNENNNTTITSITAGNHQLQCVRFEMTRHLAEFQADWLSQLQTCSAGHIRKLYFEQQPQMNHHHHHHHQHHQHHQVSRRALFTLNEHIPIVFLTPRGRRARQRNLQRILELTADNLSIYENIVGVLHRLFVGVRRRATSFPVAPCDATSAAASSAATASVLHDEFVSLVGTFRIDLLMSMNEKQLINICQSDKLHALVWCLHACLNRGRISEKHFVNMARQLDKVPFHEDACLLQDLALVFCDPYVCYIVASSTFRAFFTATSSSSSSSSSAGVCLPRKMPQVVFLSFLLSIIVQQLEQQRSVRIRRRTLLRRFALARARKRRQRERRENKEQRDVGGGEETADFRDEEHEEEEDDDTQKREELEAEYDDDDFYYFEEDREETTVVQQHKDGGEEESGGGQRRNIEDEENQIQEILEAEERRSHQKPERDRERERNDEESGDRVEQRLLAEKEKRRARIQADILNRILPAFSALQLAVWHQKQQRIRQEHFPPTAAAPGGGAASSTSAAPPPQSSTSISLDSILPHVISSFQCSSSSSSSTSCATSSGNKSGGGIAGRLLIQYAILFSAEQHEWILLQALLQIAAKLERISWRPEILQAIFASLAKSILRFCTNSGVDSNSNSATSLTSNTANLVNEFSFDFTTTTMTTPNHTTAATQSLSSGGGASGGLGSPRAHSASSGASASSSPYAIAAAKFLEIISSLSQIITPSSLPPLPHTAASKPPGSLNLLQSPPASISVPTPTHNSSNQKRCRRPTLYCAVHQLLRIHCNLLSTLLPPPPPPVLTSPTPHTPTAGSAPPSLSSSSTVASNVQNLSNSSLLYNNLQQQRKQLFLQLTHIVANYRSPSTAAPSACASGSSSSSTTTSSSSSSTSASSSNHNSSEIQPIIDLIKDFEVFESSIIMMNSKMNPGAIAAVSKLSSPPPPSSSIGAASAVGAAASSFRFAGTPGASRSAVFGGHGARVHSLHSGVPAPTPMHMPAMTPLVRHELYPSSAGSATPFTPPHSPSQRGNAAATTGLDFSQRQ